MPFQAICSCGNTIKFLHHLSDRASWCEWRACFSSLPATQTMHLHTPEYALQINLDASWESVRQIFLLCKMKTLPCLIVFSDGGRLTYPAMHFQLEASGQSDRLTDRTWPSSLWHHTSWCSVTAALTESKNGQRDGAWVEQRWAECGHVNNYELF